MLAGLLSRRAVKRGRARHVAVFWQPSTAPNVMPLSNWASAGPGHWMPNWWAWGLWTSPRPSARHRPRRAKMIVREWKGIGRKRSSAIQTALDRFTRQCTEAGVNGKTFKVFGSPAERILLEANRHDVVLISPDFRTPSSAGDTLTRVLKEAPRPMVSVPQQLPDGDAIAIAFDGSVQAARCAAGLLPHRLGSFPSRSRCHDSR